MDRPVKGKACDTRSRLPGGRPAIFGDPVLLVLRHAGIAPCADALISAEQ
jgi:hypothetical protein